MTDLEMTQTTCANCGKALTVPKYIIEHKSLAVCDQPCYHGYLHKIADTIYEVSFCAKSDWEVVKLEINESHESTPETKP